MARIRAKGERLYIRVSYHGNRYEIKTGFNDTPRGRIAARGMSSEIERAVLDNTFDVRDYRGDGRLLESFEVFAIEWLESRTKQRPSTIQGYKSAVESSLVPYFKGLSVAEINLGHVQRYASGMISEGLSPKTVRNRVGVLQRILKYAIGCKLRDDNPCSFVEIPRRTLSPKDPFSPSEVVQILDWWERNRPGLVAMIAIGFFAGLRPGEMLALKPGDIDFQSDEILIQRAMSNAKLVDGLKTSNFRRVPVLDMLKPYLVRHRTRIPIDSDWLFLNKDGEVFHQFSNIRKPWSRCLQTLGLRYRNPYQMRSTFAINALRNGAPIHWVSAVLGHSDISTTAKHYAKWIIHDLHRDGQCLSAVYKNPDTARDAK